MRIVDAHAHLLDEPGYLDHLLRTMDACGIETCCLSGIGSLFGCATNAEVESAFRAHPDRIIGAAFIRPGVDGPGRVARFHEDGFRMLKVSIPRAPYDDPAYLAIWSRADELGMPVLFHTGVVTLRDEAPSESISSWRMHPMRLEPVSRAFPDLGIIIAHLGIHWNNNAAEVARLRPNVYVDLTGEPEGWRARADRVGMDQWLWWPDAFDKVVFGTDVHHSKIPRILEEDMRRLERLQVRAETQSRVLSGNILRLLGKETE